MTARGMGSWEVELDVPAGTDYRFVLDGGDPLPDPRSPWQPAGVEGPSRTVDHGAFEWHDAGWRAPLLASAVLYELHVGTFTPGGTFEAAIARLDHLVELGVSHIELLPVAEFSGERGWGYDGVDLFAPHHAYGGPTGLRRLVDAAHRRGLAVLLDVVYNHLGPSGNYLARFGPYFTGRYETPWGAAVNYDGPDSDEVRRFVVDNARAWLRDYHLDGLRLDAEHAIFDHSAVHILEELAGAVRELQIRLGRPLVLVAESNRNDPRLVRAPEAGGFGLDSHWTDDFHHALHVALSGEHDGYYVDFAGLRDVATVLRRGYVYEGQRSAFRRRRHGRPAHDLPGERFVAFTQNHDQVGNRALGERSGRLMSVGRLKVAAALLLTAPFVPLLFQGEEWGAGTPFQYFTDHRDPALADAVREGRQAEFAAFGWEPGAVPDPQDPSTFARSTLDWTELERPPHSDLLDWHRRLIALRRSTAALLDGRLDRVTVRYDEAAGWLLVRRGGTGAGILIVCNLAGGTQTLALDVVEPTERTAPVAESGTSRAVLLASDPGAVATHGAVTLPPDSVAILA